METKTNFTPTTDIEIIRKLSPEELNAIITMREEEDNLALDQAISILKETPVDFSDNITQALLFFAFRIKQLSQSKTVTIPA